MFKIKRQECAARRREERRIEERMERRGKKMTDAGENVLPTTASLELEIYVPL